MQIGHGVLQLICRGAEEEAEVLAPVLGLILHVLERIPRDAVVDVAVDAEACGDEQRPEEARQSALALSAPQIRAHELKYHRHEQHEPQRACEGRISARKTAEAESTAPDKIDAQRTAEQEQALAHR